MIWPSVGVGVRAQVRARVRAGVRNMIQPTVSGGMRERVDGEDEEFRIYQGQWHQCEGRGISFQSISGSVAPTRGAWHIAFCQKHYVVKELNDLRLMGV